MSGNLKYPFIPQQSDAHTKHSSGSRFSRRVNNHSAALPGEAKFGAATHGYASQHSLFVFGSRTLSIL
jgi:hypothetical protein